MDKRTVWITGEPGDGKTHMLLLLESPGLDEAVVCAPTVGATGQALADYVRCFVKSSKPLFIFNAIPDVVHCAIDGTARAVAAGELVTDSTPVRQALLQVGSAINRRMLEYLASDANFLYQLPPRRFEELVARILKSYGYETALTPESHDGGWDITASRAWPFSEQLLLECKLYSANRPVPIHMARALLGVWQHRRPNRCVLVTTGRVTRSIRAFCDQHRSALTVVDFPTLIQMIRFAVSGN